MRLQRYPDGSDAWTLSIWSRHPEWSATWTHYLYVGMERKGAWTGRTRKFATLTKIQTGGWYFRVGRMHGGLQRQQAMVRTGDDQRLRDDLAYSNLRLQHAFERLDQQALTIDLLVTGQTMPAEAADRIAALEAVVKAADGLAEAVEFALIGHGRISADQEDAMGVALATYRATKETSK